MPIGQMLLARNSNTNQFTQLECDNSAHLKVVDSTTAASLGAKLDTIATNTANIKIEAESIDLNTDGLETLQTAANNTLSSIDNKVILPSALDSDRLKVYDSAVIGSLAQINNNVDGVEGKLDTIITNTAAASSTGLATEAKQDTINTSIGTTNTKIQTLIDHNDGVETLLTALDTAQDLTNSTLGDTNSKIDAMRASDTLTTVKTSTDNINSTLGDTNSKIDAMRASDTLTTVKNAIDTTETTLNAIETSLSNVATDNSILSMRVREDDAHIDRQYLIGVGVVRQDTLSSLAGTDQDTTMLSVNADGALYTAPISHEVSLHSTDRTHLSEIEGAVETIEGCVGLNKMNVNISSDAAGLATQSTLANCETALNNISVNMYNGAQQVKTILSLDGSTTGTQKQAKCNASSQLEVVNKKSYTTETSIVSSQAVSGSGTHTTSAIANDANVVEYIMERNFSGSDVSFEILESIDNSNFFNAMGMSFNDAGDPSSGLTGLSVIEIKSPYFKVKFTNANGSSRDVSLSYVAIQN